MGIANIPTRWIKMIVSHPSLDKPSEKLVAFVLNKHMDNITGKCYPSVKKIAEEASLSERTVRTALNKLVSLGLIVRYQEKFKRGGYFHYVYYPKIIGEIIATNDINPVEIKTQIVEINNQNQRKQLPPNYPENYLYNYDNKIKNNDKHGKMISITDVGEIIDIYESEINTKEGLRNTLKHLKNRYAQESLLNWIFDNNLSEVKGWDQLKKIE